MKYPAIAEEDLFVGATITVYSRQYKLTEYGDEFTKKAFDQQYHLEKTFAMIKPEQYVNIGKIVQVIEQSGFRITNLRMLKLSGYESHEFFQNSGM
jgi:nucleoside-diphosphate kinase